MERNLKNIENRQHLLKQRISRLSLPNGARSGSRLGQTSGGEYFVHSSMSHRKTHQSYMVQQN